MIVGEERSARLHGDLAVAIEVILRCKAGQLELAYIIDLLSPQRLHPNIHHFRGLRRRESCSPKSHVDPS
jgi:hypothetical protein